MWSECAWKNKKDGLARMVLLTPRIQTGINVLWHYTGIHKVYLDTSATHASIRRRALSCRAGHPTQIYIKKEKKRTKKKRGILVEYRNCEQAQVSRCDIHLCHRPRQGDQCFGSVLPGWSGTGNLLSDLTPPQPVTASYVPGWQVQVQNSTR